MAQNSDGAKDAKGAKPKRRTIKVEIPVPHVPVRSALRKGARGAMKGKEKIKRKLSVNERPAWSTPGNVDDRRKELLLGAVIVAAAVVLVLVFTGPGALVMPPAESQDEGSVPLGWNVITDMREKVSFDRYMDNYLAYADGTVSLHGFLRNRIADAPGAGMGVYEYYVVDDFGREIRLIDMGMQQTWLFPRNATTKGLYNVTGVVKVRYAGFDLRVGSIEKA